MYASLLWDLSTVAGKLSIDSTLSLTYTPEPVMTYLLEDYEGDIAGQNVTASVHVEACAPGNPVKETRLVWG